MIDVLSSDIWTGRRDDSLYIFGLVGGLMRCECLFDVAHIGSSSG